MTVHFYIDNIIETELFTLYNHPIAPFKEGDEIKLSVDDLVPKDLIKGNDTYNKNILEKNNKLKEECHLLTAKIVRMKNFADISVLRNNITIEYHCEIIEDYDNE